MIVSRIRPIVMAICLIVIAACTLTACTAARKYTILLAAGSDTPGESVTVIIDATHSRGEAWGGAENFPLEISAAPTPFTYPLIVDVGISVTATIRVVPRNPGQVVTCAILVNAVTRDSGVGGSRKNPSAFCRIVTSGV